MMNKLIFLFILFSSLLFSQKLVTKFDENVFYKIQINYNDGSSETFESNKIKFKDRLTIAPMGLTMKFKKFDYDNPNLSELTFNMKDKQQKKVPKNNINLLTIENTETGVIDKYKNVDIYKYDKDLNLELEAENILLPIRYEDNINILGFRVYMESNGQKEYMNTFSYFNNTNDKVAINPIDLNNIFNTDLIARKFIAALKEVTKDCPDYYSQYEIDITQKITKDQKKAKMQEYMARKKEIMKESKNIPKNLRQDFIDTELENYFLMDNLKLLIAEYNKTCNK